MRLTATLMGESKTAAYLDAVTREGHQSTTRDSLPWPTSCAASTLYGPARQAKAGRSPAAQLAPRVLRRQGMGAHISEDEAGSSQARIRFSGQNPVEPSLPLALPWREREIQHKP